MEPEDRAAVICVIAGAIALIVVMLAFILEPSDVEACAKMGCSYSSSSNGTQCTCQTQKQ